MRTLYEQQHRHHSECGANRAVQLHTTRQLSAPSSELLRDKRLRAEACLCLLLRQQPAEPVAERDKSLRTLPEQQRSASENTPELSLQFVRRGRNPMRSSSAERNESNICAIGAP